MPPGVRSVILLIAFSTLVDAYDAAAQTREFLRAPRVQSRLRLQWDPAVQRVVAAVDDHDGFQPLSSSRPFLTDGALAVTYPRLNPLRVEVVSGGPSTDNVSTRLRALLALAAVPVVPAATPGDQGSIPSIASSTNSCPALVTARRDAEVFLSAVFVSPRAVTVAALVSSWRQAIDRAFGDGRDGAAAVSTAVAMMDELLTQLDAQLGQGERVVARMEAETARSAPSQSCDLSARQVYEALAIANPRARLIQLRAVRSAVMAVRDVLSRDYVSPAGAKWRGSEYRLASNVRPTNDSPVNLPIHVTYLRFDVDDVSGALTVMDEGRISETVLIQRWSRFAKEFAIATILGSVTRPGYGTTNAAGVTVVGRLPRSFASVEPAFLASLVCRCQTGPLVAPMLQIGMTTSKDVPALLVGGGVRLFGLPKGDVALGGGGMFAWVKDLRTLRVGDEVGGTSDIESDLHYARRQGYYLALQYKF